jgi:hypothetical protein
MCFLFYSNNESSIDGCNIFMISPEVLLKLFKSIKSSNYVTVYPFEGELNGIIGLVIETTIFRDLLLLLDGKPELSF